MWKSAFKDEIKCFALHSWSVYTIHSTSVSWKPLLVRTKPWRQKQQTEKNITSLAVLSNTAVPLSNTNKSLVASPVLTNPVASCSSLQVVLRVEVTVHKNDCVSGCQVQAHSPCRDHITLSEKEHVSRSPLMFTHMFTSGAGRRLAQWKSDNLCQETRFLSS